MKITIQNNPIAVWNLFPKSFLTVPLIEDNPFVSNVMGLLLLFLLPSFLKAQVHFMPTNFQYGLQFEQALHDPATERHTLIKPYNPFQMPEFIDSLALARRIKGAFWDQKWLGRVLVNEALLDVRKEDYSFWANPLLELSLGSDSRLEDDSPWRNTRGFQLQGTIGPQVAYYTEFWENQARFPAYIDDWIRDNTRGEPIIPGQGIPKPFNNEPLERDFAWVAGAVNLQAGDFFNFELGYGKQFIGDGYRSLLLSDNAFNYPYFRIQTSFGIVQYTNLYTQLRDLRFTNIDGDFGKKYMVAHQLSLNITPRLNIGLYEAVTYGDSLGTRGLEWEYMIPVILLRPIEFGLGSEAGNVLMGINLKYELSPATHVYGQFMFDEFKFDEFFAGDGWWANKFGVQMGVKSFDLLGVEGLSGVGEFNLLRPYTYTHFNTRQNYAHYNQPLAHPLGANFEEFLLFLNYHKDRWFVETQAMYALQGRDTLNSNWGADVYLDSDNREQDYGNEIGQGVRSNTLILSARAGWQINPTNNLRLEVGYTRRQFRPEVIENGLENTYTNYFYVGLVTRWRNQYLDF